MSSFSNDFNILHSCSISLFKGSTIACDIFLGGWTTGIADWFTSSFTISCFIVPTPSKISGYSFDYVSFTLRSKFEIYVHWRKKFRCKCLSLVHLRPFGKSFIASTVTCLHVQLSLQITFTRKVESSTEIQTQYDLSIHYVSNIKQTLLDHIGMSTCHSYPASQC